MFKRNRNMVFDFTDYRSLKEIFKGTYKKNSIDRTEDIQKEFDNLPDSLGKDRPRDFEYINKRSKLLDNAKIFYDRRKIIVDAF